MRPGKAVDELRGSGAQAARRQVAGDIPCAAPHPDRRHRPPRTGQQPPGLGHPPLGDPRALAEARAPVTADRAVRRGLSRYGPARRTVRATTPFRPLPEGASAMADKSPHDAHSAKKSGKSLKTKRAERKETKQSTAAVERLLHPRKAPRT
jgi:hypothetical protein